MCHEVKTHEFENHGPFASPLMVFVFFVFIFPAFIAPFGTTILGWISVTQIRRSAGKLHGLGLAVFDGLLFPLLALDGVFVWVVRRLVQIFVEFYSNFSNLNKLEVHPSFTTQLANLFSQHSELVAFIAVSIIIVVDFLIIRAVWRAVNRGSPSPLADQAAINEAEWRDPRNWSAGIYFSKRDSRTHVPKRIPALGWTVNLGRWQGVLLLFGVILLVVAALVVGLQQVISQQKPAVIQQTTATETSGFGPVIERELSANATLTNAFLNLDTGKVLSAPKEFLDSLRAKGRLNNGSPQAYAVREWMSSSGADVIALVGFGKPSRLVQVDGVSVSVGEKPPQPGGYTFDTVTAALLMKTITLPSLDDSEKQWFYFPSIISSFKTREGRIGVLEILDAKPDKVKLRYKLVLGGATNAAAFWQTPRVRLEQQLLRAMEQNLSATATGASPERGEFIDYELLGVDVAKDLRTAKIDLAGVKPRWSSPHKELWKRVPKGEFGASDEGSGMWIVTGKGDLGALQFKVQVTNLVEQAQPAAVFGLQAERMIAATDANPDGVVAFRFENNFPFQPPVAVTGHFKDPAKIGFTPELRRWMQDENVDLLFYFDKKAYYVLSFNLRTGWAGQPKEWDTILPDCAVPQLTKMEKLNSEPAGPSIMGGCGYRDGLGEVSVFRTRGGLVGFYQLRGLADADGRGVNIRYKLVQGGAPQTASVAKPSPVAKPTPAATNAPADATLAFGLVIEREVNDLQTTGENCALSFDSGKLLPVPANITLGMLSQNKMTKPPSQAEAEAWVRAQEEALTWARSNQVDAVAFVTADTSKIVKCGLLCPDVLAIRTGNGAWNQATPALLEQEFVRVASQLGLDRLVEEITSDDNFPTTYLILDTRTHRKGVLQILGVADNPLRVKLRYKLVQSAASKNSDAK